MGRKRAELTQDLVKSLVHYDPDTGVFTWKQPAARVAVGDVVGSMDSEGYLCTKVRGNPLKLHRLAWFYMKGVWPKNIDHINRCKTDNRWQNLRAVTDESIQQQNKGIQKNNKTGVKGVSYRVNRNIYVARVRVNKMQVFYSEFKTLEEAREARLAAERKHLPYSPLNAAGAM